MENQPKPIFELPFCVQVYTYKGQDSFTNRYDLRNVFMIKDIDENSCAIYPKTDDLGMTIYCSAKELQEQMSNLEIIDVKKINLEPTDIIALSTKLPLPIERLELIRKVFSDNLPFKNKVVVLEQMGLSIITQK